MTAIRPRHSLTHRRCEDCYRVLPFDRFRDRRPASRPNAVCMGCEVLNSAVRDVAENEARRRRLRLPNGQEERPDA